MTRPYLLREVDVLFRTLEESSVEPPNPQYLKVHAAFAKVLHLCRAAEHMYDVERDAEMEGTLRLNGETDFGSYLYLFVRVFFCVWLSGFCVWCV
jgi:hypothetical protein